MGDSCKDCNDRLCPGPDHSVTSCVDSFGASAMDVACPFCGAGIDVECAPMGNVRIKGQPHAQRAEISPEFRRYYDRAHGDAPPSSTPFALSVTCPTCHVAADEPCILLVAETPSCLPHLARVELKAGVAPIDHIRPKHYGGADDPYEPLKVMLAQHGRDAVVSFCWLTAEKYLARAGKKPGEPIERDFRKAAFYLTHAAELLERKL